ncbi:unnamed protein product, partial [marine sediment metagenome]
KICEETRTCTKVFCSSKEESMESDGTGALITSEIVEILDAPFKVEKTKEGIISTDEQE